MDISVSVRDVTGRVAEVSNNSISVWLHRCYAPKDELKASECEGEVGRILGRPQYHH